MCMYKLSHQFEGEHDSNYKSATAQKKRYTTDATSNTALSWIFWGEVRIDSASWPLLDSRWVRQGCRDLGGIEMNQLGNYYFFVFPGPKTWVKPWVLSIAARLFVKHEYLQFFAHTAVNWLRPIS